MAIMVLFAIHDKAGIYNNLDTQKISSLEENKYEQTSKYNSVYY